MRNFSLKSDCLIILIKLQKKRIQLMEAMMKDKLL